MSPDERRRLAEALDNPLVGKILTAIYLAEDRGAIKFEVEGQQPIIARADGGCCSHTWIESVENPDQVIGSEIRSVDGVPLCKPDGEKDSWVVKFYACRITSLKGYCLIDYRNESNGYYGGNLAWPEDYFDGGAYGQNVSEEVWKLVV